MPSANHRLPVRTVVGLLTLAVILTGCAAFGPPGNQSTPASAPAGAAAAASPAPTQTSAATAPTTAGTPANTAQPATSAPVVAEATPPAPAPPATPEAQFQDAIKLMQAHDYEKAEPLLLGLTQKQPKLAGPFTNLGILYARSNRPQQAAQALQQAIALNPRNADAQNQLGIVLRQSGQLQAAEQAYKAALSASPDYANAHLNLGVLYDVYLKRAADALPQYEQYQRLAPADAARVAVWIAELKQRMQAKP